MKTARLFIDFRKNFKLNIGTVPPLEESSGTVFFVVFVFVLVSNGIFTGYR